MNILMAVDEAHVAGAPLPIYKKETVKILVIVNGHPLFQGTRHFTLSFCPTYGLGGFYGVDVGDLCSYKRHSYSSLSAPQHAPRRIRVVCRD